MNKRYFDMVDGERREKVTEGLQKGDIGGDGIAVYGRRAPVTFANGDGNGRSYAWQDVIATQTVLRFDWWTGQYYQIELDNELMGNVVQQFSTESNEIPWNLDHNNFMTTEAYGWTRDLRLQDDDGRSLIQGDTQWTQDTIDEYLTTDKYKYVSAELSYADLEEAVTEGQMATHLTGIALTNIPAIRGMNAVSLKLGLEPFAEGDLGEALSRYTQVFMPATNTTISTSLIAEEDDMPKEKDVSAMSKEELLAYVEEQAVNIDELRETVQEQGKSMLEATLKTDFAEHVNRGAVTPANAQKYKEHIQESELSQMVKDTILMVLADVEDNSQVDLSEVKSDPTFSNDKLDADNSEKEAFVKKRVGELMQEGRTEYQAVSIARKEWSNLDDKDDE